MFRWYVINTYSGHEQRVREDLWRRADSLNARHFIRAIEIPTEKVYEGSGDERKQVEKRTMPGYVLINIDLNEDSYAVVRYTPGVTGFVGGGGQPEPLGKMEVDRLLGKAEKSALPTKAVAASSVGDSVTITDGPLKALTGNVVEIDEAAGRAKVLVSIFGRETPAEVGFGQLQTAKG